MDLDYPEAQRRFEAGESLRDIGDAVGCSRETIRRVANERGWRRLAEVPGAAQTAAARERSHATWAERRSEEADAAGITAAIARQRVIEALRAGDDKMTRAASIAYGILIDKAQLLSGAATGVFDHRHTTPIDEELERLTSELEHQR